MKTQVLSQKKIEETKGENSSKPKKKKTLKKKGTKTKIKSGKGAPVNYLPKTDQQPVKWFISYCYSSNLHRVVLKLNQM